MNMVDASLTTIPPGQPPLDPRACRVLRLAERPADIAHENRRVASGIEQVNGTPHAGVPAGSWCGRIPAHRSMAL